MQYYLHVHHVYLPKRQTDFCKQQDFRLCTKKMWKDDTSLSKYRHGQSTSSGTRIFDEIETTTIKKESVVCAVQVSEYRGNTKRFKLGYCFLFLIFHFFIFNMMSPVDFHIHLHSAFVEPPQVYCLQQFCSLFFSVVFLAASIL